MGIHILFAILAGTIMGFLGSMPIAGPVAVLVLERGLVRRGREGLGVALGAAAAESIYAFLAFWGLGAVLYASPTLLRASRLVGVGVMITLGVYLANRKSAPRPPEAEGDALVVGRKRRGFLLGPQRQLPQPHHHRELDHDHGHCPLHRPRVAGPDLGRGLCAGGWRGHRALVRHALHLLHRFQSGLRPQTVDRVLHITGWLVVAIGVSLGIRPFIQAFGWLRP
jgi:hypothetical protein